MVIHVTNQSQEKQEDTGVKQRITAYLRSIWPIKRYVYSPATATDYHSSRDETGALMVCVVVYGL